jgi:hypothetical protein
MFLRAALPERDLSAETKDVVKVTVALIATMAALVLSLLVSSTKTAYDTRSRELVQMSSDERERNCPRCPPPPTLVLSHNA